MKAFYISFGFNVIFVLVAFFAWFYPVDLNEKQLSLSLTSYSTILDINKNLDKNDLTFFYKNIEVKNLKLIQILIQNNGPRSIEIEDFLEKVHFVFPKEIKLISYNVDPPDALDIEFKNNNVYFSSKLINPGNKATLEILFDDPQNKFIVDNFKVEGKIREVKELKIENKTALEIIGNDPISNLLQDPLFKKE